MPFLAYLIALLFMGSLGAQEDRPLILVSIPAYQQIVQELVGDCATVSPVVPVGMNLHTFEPAPQHLKNLSQAILWFGVGDVLEKKIGAAFKEGSGPVMVDLRRGVPLIFGGGCQHVMSADPHIWTSPIMMKIQLTTMKEVLEDRFPQEAKNIELRYVALSTKLDDLIQEVDQLLSPYRGGIIVIAHAAYGYLCRDFGLIQQAIESEGKEPTLGAMEKLMKVATDHHVKTIFVMPQYPVRGAERVASLLKAKIVLINPYDVNYFSSTKMTAEKFAGALAEQQG
jgi:zinc transport system substrate-binding protein